MCAKFWVIGVNYKTVDVASRERWVLGEEASKTLFARLQEEQLLSECVLVATCNRVELYGVSAPERFQEIQILKIWGEVAGVSLPEPGYIFRDEQAILHLFRVVTSLDALVVGEPQILGQMKQAYACAVKNGMIGMLLHQMFQQSFAVAKRVREKTGMGRHPVSVASIAVRLAEQIFHPFDGLKVLVVGAGEVGCEVAQLFSKQGVGALVVSNRSSEAGLQLADSLKAVFCPWDLWQKSLVDADIVLFATAAKEFLLRFQEAEGLIKKRNGKPLFLIDLSSPRNVDPEVGRLDHVFLYNVDDLERVAAENRVARLKEAEKAEKMIEALVQEAAKTFAPSPVDTTIASLHAKWEEIRKLELEKTFAKHPEWSVAEKEAMELMTKAMIKKMMKDPVVSLRSLQEESGAPTGILHFLRRLFALENA